MTPKEFPVNPEKNLEESIDEINSHGEFPIFILIKIKENPDSVNDEEEGFSYAMQTNLIDPRNLVYCLEQQLIIAKRNYNI